jgi:hypothetical protein
MQNSTSTDVERVPRRYRISRGLNLFLVKSLKVPRIPAIRMARFINVAASPLAQLRRRRLAAAIIRARGMDRKRIAIGKRDGYAFVSIEDLPEIGAAIAEAQRVYAVAVERESLERRGRRESKKSFLQYAVQGAETSRCRDIMKLALSRRLIDAVTEYLGEVPVIGNVSVMVSLPNESQVGSQLYHLDFADEKQVKLFVYVDAVSLDNGPFTFAPLPVTEELLKTYKYDRGRLSIEQVRKAVGSEREIQLTGPAGTRSSAIRRAACTMVRTEIGRRASCC